MNVATRSITAPSADREPNRQPSTSIELHLRPFSRLLYALSGVIGRFTWFCTIRCEILNAQAMQRTGGYLLASSHFSHLEPFLLAFLYERPIDWMTRIEFFHRRWTRWLLPRLGGFPVNRQGVPVSAIRTSIARVQQGRIVGICPEGGVTAGKASVCRGGKIKRGICLISYRTGKPVVPCVVIGTHTLNVVKPWLPFRRIKLWMAFGEPIFPDQTITDRKVARADLAEKIEQRCVSLYRELCERFGIVDASIP
jgi:1-acyl-sn-glycerol-3-phosphate acyltransferase